MEGLVEDDTNPQQPGPQSERFWSAKYLELRKKFTPKRPEGPLFHYTTLFSFKKIMEGKILWASNLLYLNDMAEFRHGLDLAAECLEKRLSDPSAARKWSMSWKSLIAENVSRGPFHFRNLAIHSANGAGTAARMAESALGSATNFSSTGVSLLKRRSQRLDC
jgi:hypothetical protein